MMARGIAARRREGRLRRHRRVRRRIAGTADRPRLAVFRSLRHISAQVIDDDAGHTLAAASTRDPALRDEIGGAEGKRGQASVVGRVIAERAQAAGIEHVVFDRGGYRFHGRVRALASAAREAGLEF